ncbi:UNVERIFIED_CONTAM: hypothetical protein FKN15_039009 [Acipenser sinensis]
MSASYRLHQPCRAAQEHRRFSEHPPIPRASQLPLLHPGTRERCQRATGFTSPAELLRNTEGSVSVLRSHERASFLFYTQELESDVSELPASPALQSCSGTPKVQSVFQGSAVLVSVFLGGTNATGGAFCLWHAPGYLLLCQSRQLSAVSVTGKEPLLEK